MAEDDKSLQSSPSEASRDIAAPRKEQLLFACGGYVVAQLIALVFIRDPSDGDYLQLGIAGAFIGVVAHVLVRGVGIKIPVIGRQFRVRLPKRRAKDSTERKSADDPNRAARYRAALAAFRRPFRRRSRKSEAPGNEDRIVETEDGFRVGERLFSRRAEAEDFLYLGDSPEGGAKARGRADAPAVQHWRSIPWRKPGVRNSIFVAVAFLLAALFVLFA